jgi:hypothetical protein
VPNKNNDTYVLLYLAGSQSCVQAASLEGPVPVRHMAACALLHLARLHLHVETRVLERPVPSSEHDHDCPWSPSELKAYPCAAHDVLAKSLDGSSQYRNWQTSTSMFCKFNLSYAG